MVEILALSQNSKGVWERDMHVVLIIESTTIVSSIPANAPLSSLMDSTMSPKVKTLKGKEVGVRSLACNTLRVEGRTRVLGWD